MGIEDLVVRNSVGYQKLKKQKREVCRSEVAEAAEKDVG